ncbi:MAG: PDZ domain-containing protein [Micropepsaceae bacterium]
MRALAFLVFVFGLAAFKVSADVPPPYDLYGIGATMVDREPFPTIGKVDKGGPAALAGVKLGDQVLALNGTYSATLAPFYFFARGLEGPKDSVAEVIVLRKDTEVLVIKVKRTVREGH